MGAQIYLLDRRKVNLLVDGLPQKIGTLRCFWKVTEINRQRAAEITAAETRIKGKTAPRAVMIADVTELPLAAEPSRAAFAHLVLGWDADRSQVTDFGWDHLPILGYAVKKAGSSNYTLHEEQDGFLHSMTLTRALKLEVLNQNGKLVRHGQPAITECVSVRSFIPGYVKAHCVLSDGRAAALLAAIEGDKLPCATWYIGKRPADVVRYPEV